jgi:hypothetical protein
VGRCRRCRSLPRGSGLLSAGNVGLVGDPHRSLALYAPFLDPRAAPLQSPWTATELIFTNSFALHRIIMPLPSSTETVAFGTS